MIIIQQPSVLRKYVQQLQDVGKSTGFIPTMGALHEGHIGLVKASKRQDDFTICSIFVNPTQFNVRSDFDKYPNRLPNDIKMLELAGTDVLFLPKVSDIYPDGTTDLEQYPLGYLETVLEGQYRPGHFQGVCQVMSRLLQAVRPNNLYMGQKDYQQCMVVRKLVAQLALPIHFVPCETQRDPDGLAMSSRNLRLTEKDRQIAPHIYKSLKTVKENLAPGDLNKLKSDATAYLATLGFKVDYFEIADADTLQLLSVWNGTTPLVALVAAFLGEVRLIDNLILTS